MEVNMRGRLLRGRRLGLVLCVVAVAFAPGKGAFAQECAGFYDELNGLSEFGQVNGGSFTDGGWKAVSTGDHIMYDNQPIAISGKLEFEVKGLGPNQPCGECLLWWFGANDRDPIGELSEWATVGRRIGPNWTCVDCNPEDFIDRVKMGAGNWCRRLGTNYMMSDDVYEWDAAHWYQMVIEWKDQSIYWSRDSVEMIRFNRGTCVYQPHLDAEFPATKMLLMIGSDWQVAKQAVFRNVRFTPYECADVEPIENLDSEFISQDVPLLVTPGQTFPVSISMRNTGELAWTRDDKIKLGSQSPANNLTWGTHRIKIDFDLVVPPGTDYSFVWDLTAPLEEGTYPFHWRMLDESAAENWFGQQTELLQIVVSENIQPDGGQDAGNGDELDGGQDAGSDPGEPDGADAGQQDAGGDDKPDGGQVENTASSCGCGATGYGSGIVLLFGLAFLFFIRRMSEHH